MQNPNDPAIRAKFAQALALHQKGDLDAAALEYNRIITLQPTHSDALHHLGLVHLQRGAFADAIPYIERSLAQNSRQPNAHSNLAHCFNLAGQPLEALASCDVALSLDASNTAALTNRGNALRALKRHDEALEAFGQVARLTPGDARAIYNIAVAQFDLGSFDLALAGFSEALKRAPGNPEVEFNLAATQVKLRHTDEALRLLDRLIDRYPDHLEARLTRGIALALQSRAADALADFDFLVNNGDDGAGVRVLRGNALDALKRYPEAAESFDAAIARDPGIDFALGSLLHAKLQHCDWTAYEETLERLRASVREGKKSVLPYNFLCMTDSAEEQLICAQTLVRDTIPQAENPLCSGRKYDHEKIRLAYVSADFREHPIAYIFSDLIAKHDRDRFEIVGISLSPDDGSGIGTRIRGAFDSLIDAGQLGDAETAGLLCEMEIDIAVDLMGHTRGGRPAIFAHRPAPVQVNFLGHAGTTGAPFMDYIIADRTVVTEPASDGFSEMPVFLPHTYWPALSMPARTLPPPTRAEAKLPDSGFVFCCFNQQQRIGPPVFSIWMDLLGEVEDSVLWLIESNETAQENLKSAAHQRGISPERLVFAPRLENDAHLARLQLADLVLDTLPYNVHTTATDALVAGVPVVTRAGNAFAGRVAASLLRAAGLADLVTETADAYFSTALGLARDDAALIAVRDRIAEQQRNGPLFDTGLYRRHIEAAYVEMADRYRDGLAPDIIRVAG